MREGRNMNPSNKEAAQRQNVWKRPTGGPPSVSVTLKLRKNISSK